VFILHKKLRRDALGKHSEFRLHGQVISAESVKCYFQWKGGIPDQSLFIEDSAPSTPPHISYRTPSPEPPGNDLQSVSNEGQLPRSECSLRASLGCSIWELETHCRTQNIPPGYSLSYVSTNQIKPDLQPSLSAPETFRVFEELIFNINSYYNGSFENQTWVSDYSGNCINVQTGGSKTQDLEKFRGLCKYLIIGASL